MGWSMGFLNLSSALWTMCFLPSSIEALTHAAPQLVRLGAAIALSHLTPPPCPCQANRTQTTEKAHAVGWRTFVGAHAVSQSLKGPKRRY